MKWLPNFPDLRYLKDQKDILIIHLGHLVRTRRNQIKCSASPYLTVWITSAFRLFERTLGKPSHYPFSAFLLVWQTTGCKQPRWSERRCGQSLHAFLNLTWLSRGVGRFLSLFNVTEVSKLQITYYVNCETQAMFLFSLKSYNQNVLLWCKIQTLTWNKLLK